MSDVLGTIAQGVNPLTTVSNVVNIQRGMQDLRAQQFALQQAKLQPAYAGLMALRLQTKANGGPGVSWDGIISSLADSQRLGADISGMTTDINEAMARGENPDDIVRGMSIRGMPPFEQFGAVTPETGMVDTGTGIIPVTIGARGGATPGAVTQASPAILRGLTPEQAWGQRVTTFGPTGQPLSVPLGMTVPPSAGGIGGGGYGGVAPSGGVSAPQGAPTSSLETPNKQAFVQAFTPIAQRISQATGLPVNYVIGQAGLETGWGTSRASGANNFFGISPGGTLASYPTPDAGAQAYVNLVNNDPRYASLPRTGTPQEIGDRFAQAGYNPAVPGGPGGPSYGARIQSFAAGLPAPGSYQVASNTPVAPPGQATSNAPAAAPGLAPGGSMFNPVITPPWGLQPEFEAGAKQHAADIGALQDLPKTTQPLLNAINILKANPTLTTGGGQDQWNAWVGALNSAGIPLPDWGKPNTTPQWQELAKYLAQNARSMPGANQSDLARIEAEASSPKIDQQRDAILALAARQIGMSRFQVAPVKYFDAQFPDAATAANMSPRYRLATANWTANQDPVAYAADLMAPQDTQSYYQHLNAQQQERYRNSLGWAKQLFGIQLPIPAGK